MKSTRQKIYLIRHGETDWTVQQKHTGLTDVSLTEFGRRQAKAIGERLKDHSFKKVLVSPLERAKRTCEIAGYLDQAEIDSDLVEWNYGDYEGKTNGEILKENPNWMIFTHGAPNGESVADVGLRVKRILNKVKNIEGDVAIFSSGHFLRSFTARWLDLAIEDGRLFLLTTGSISILGYERSQRVIISWNQLFS
ncbi:MAG: histidine phosphatase family protein [Chlamydiae bacterium]|nr:histidine phosphatase family protein [Chlamydiota bacterium]